MSLLDKAVKVCPEYRAVLSPPADSRGKEVRRELEEERKGEKEKTIAEWVLD